MSNGDKLTQMPSFAERVVLAEKSVAVRPGIGIGQPGVAAGSTAVAAAALPLQLAVACIPPVALPHIAPVGHTGRMR
jgi:hypothetical protein